MKSLKRYDGNEWHSYNVLLMKTNAEANNNSKRSGKNSRSYDRFSRLRQGKD